MKISGSGLVKFCRNPQTYSLEFLFLVPSKEMKILQHQKFITNTDNLVYLGKHVLADIKFSDFQSFYEILAGIRK